MAKAEISKSEKISKTLIGYYLLLGGVGASMEYGVDRPFSFSDFILLF